MRMHNRVSVVVALLFATSLFASCSGGDSKRTARRGSSSTKPATKSSSSENSPAKKSTATAEEGGWADITGQFVIDGEAPTATKLTITKDEALCNQFNLVNEAVSVGEGNGLANVVIYLRDSKAEVHPDLKAAEATEPVLDNLNCRFEPHVSLVQAGQTLVVKNSDPVAHNSNLSLQANQAQNLLIPAKEQETFMLSAEERVPCKVTCNIHPWMVGWVVVRDNPYMAVTDKDGKFKIEKVPSGVREFQLWHETAGYLGNLKVGEFESSKKGRVKLALNPGSLDLGVIKVSADDLK